MFFNYTMFSVFIVQFLENRADFCCVFDISNLHFLVCDKKIVLETLRNQVNFFKISVQWFAFYYRTCPPLF